jgi:hypothetical protein
MFHHNTENIMQNTPEYHEMLREAKQEFLEWEREKKSKKMKNKDMYRQERLAKQDFLERMR